MSARLATEPALAKLGAALEKQASQVTPEVLQSRVLALLGALGTPALPATCTVYGTLKNESARGAFRVFLASKVTESPEPIVALTLHSERKVVEEAIALLATGGTGSPTWKHLEAIAKNTDGKVRNQIAAELVERLSGEKDRKECVRVVLTDLDKAKRLAAAEQLKASPGTGRSFDELATYIQEDRFAARDEDEVIAVIAAMTAMGKLRAVRVLTQLAEKKTLLFRRNETRKVALAAQKQLELLKGRGGA